MKDSLRTLVELALARDEGAWSTLYLEHVALVKRTLQRRIHVVPADELQELQAEVWRRAFTGLPRLRCPEAFPAWLIEIADNVASTYLARPRRPGLSTDVGESEEGAASLQTPDRRRAIDLRLSDKAQVARFLGALPKGDRRIVLLRYVGGYTSREIASFVGISEDAVRQRLHRAMKTMGRDSDKEK